MEGRLAAAHVTAAHHEAKVQLPNGRNGARRGPHRAGGRLRRVRPQPPAVHVVVQPRVWAPRRLLASPRARADPAAVLYAHPLRDCARLLLHHCRAHRVAAGGALVQARQRPHARGLPLSRVRRRDRSACAPRAVQAEPALHWLPVARSAGGRGPLCGAARPRASRRHVLLRRLCPSMDSTCCASSCCSPSRSSTARRKTARRSAWSSSSANRRTLSWSSTRAERSCPTPPSSSSRGPFASPRAFARSSTRRTGAGRTSACLPSRTFSSTRCCRLRCTTCSSQTQSSSTETRGRRTQANLSAGSTTGGPRRREASGASSLRAAARTPCRRASLATLLPPAAVLARTPRRTLMRCRSTRRTLSSSQSPSARRTASTRCSAARGSGRPWP
eukprot:Opistho-1_new@38747